MFLSKTEKELAVHENWLNSVSALDLDSKILSQSEIEKHVPGGQAKWAGAVYTPSDGRAEPALATPAIAQAAQKKGAILIENCAVRGLLRSAGAISAVMTEQGEIRCEKVLLAGGAWSRKFLANEGVSLPTLPLICTAIRTKPMDLPYDIAVGGPDFSFRKHEGGGYIITQRSALKAPLTLDHLLLGLKYLEPLKTQLSVLRLSLSSFFIDDLNLGRRWNMSELSPFEKCRVMDPATIPDINQEALDNLSRAWPGFENAEIDEAWAGLMDVTPDSNPVIDRIEKIPGLTIATGMSGHGFGTGPAAGELAADIVSENPTPLVSPLPYAFSRL
jgi:glycine/D-amino acid oxidase-like deaminating enzyme